MNCKLAGILNGEKWKHYLDIQKRVYCTDGLCSTIHTMQGGQRHIKIMINNEKGKKYRIRKLTPRECWRFMGFDDSDFDKAKAVGVSDTQLYKQAGNSIVVNVVEAIIKQIFGEVLE